MPERNLIDFAKVVLLADQGLPTQAIRQATGFSIRLTEKYVALDKQYDVPDFKFAMAGSAGWAKGRDRTKTNQERRLIQRMMEDNGASKRFSNLASRELPTVQIAHLRTQLDLAERSVLAEAAVDLTNNHLQQWEEKKRDSPSSTW